MVISGLTTTFQQVSEIRRKIGIPAGSLIPIGGFAGQVLGKASPADYDTAWLTVLGGIVMAGNGIVFAGNTIHFGQAAAYTAGAIPFATAATTMGFDAANLFWDDANNYLGIGTNAPTDRLTVLRNYADALERRMVDFHATTSVSAVGKRTLHSLMEVTGASNFAVNLFSAGAFSTLHQGSGNITGSSTHAIELYCGKGTSGTGNMGSARALFIQIVNSNAIGTITFGFGLEIATPTTTGPITTYRAINIQDTGATEPATDGIDSRVGIYQAGLWDANFFGGNISVGTAAFHRNDIIRCEKTFTSTGHSTGVAAILTVNPSGVHAEFNAGGYFVLSSAGVQNFTYGVESLIGVIGLASHSGSGTCAGAMGGRFYGSKNSTGVVTTLTGARLGIQNTNATGAVTTGYGLFIETPVVTGAITTNYQAYLAAGAGGTSYGLVQVGTADLNYLAGFSAFGSSAPVNTTFALFGASTAAISSQRILRGSAAYAGTVEGDYWNDFTQHCLTGYIAGVKQFDCRTLFVQTASQTVTNTNAETTLFGAGVGTLSCPTNFFVVGKTLEIVLKGIHTMDATPPDITFRVKLGAVTFASVNYTDLNDANQYFEIRFLLTCRTTGAGGTGIGQGYVLMHESTGASNTDMHELVMTATAAMDTTAALTLDVTAQPNAADAGSSITITNAYVRVLA